MTTYSKGDNTKANIVQAAGQLAAEHGLAHVTTRMVAERAGENIGSIHYHFGGKDGLFEAVVREAIGGCCHTDDTALLLSDINENSTSDELAGAIRALISSEITDMFRSDRPAWHVPVVYQLLQRDDHLYEIFDEAVLKPSVEAFTRFFLIIDPELSPEEIHLHAVLMKMPIFAHADYMKTMLKMLGTDKYLEAYLQKMEDLLVKQTQLLLGLPLDK
jgi:AcrR family transcriptional regulator